MLALSSSSSRSSSAFASLLRFDALFPRLFSSENPALNKENEESLRSFLASLRSGGAMRATSRSAGCRHGRGYGDRGTIMGAAGGIKMLEMFNALPLRERRWKATRRRTHPSGLSYIVGGISPLRGEGIRPRAVGVWAPPTPKPSSAPPLQNFRDSKLETKIRRFLAGTRRAPHESTQAPNIHCSNPSKPLRASTKSRTAGRPHRVTAHYRVTANSLARSHIDGTRQFRAKQRRQSRKAALLGGSGR